MLNDVIQPTGFASVKSKIVATENISAFKVATNTGKTANSGVAAHNGRIAGITLSAINNGFSGLVVAEGPIKNTGWSWTIGDLIFLNGTNLSTVSPTSGFRVVIGYATNTDTIYVDISECIRL